MFLSAVWTLILTAPIHCRASIAETLMQRHISTNLIKKQTHPNFWWPENERIFISGWTILSNIMHNSFHFQNLTLRHWESKCRSGLDFIQEQIGWWNMSLYDQVQIRLLHLHSHYDQESVHTFSLTLMILIQTAIWTCSWQVSWDSRDSVRVCVELRWIFYGGQ